VSVSGKALCVYDVRDKFGAEFRVVPRLIA
jgi:hypothetical protein